MLPKVFLTFQSVNDISVFIGQFIRMMLSGTFQLCSLFCFVLFSFNEESVLVVCRSADYGLRLPSVLVFKRSDPYQPMSIFSDPFTPQFIVDFVHRSNIPSFVSIWAVWHAATNAYKGVAI